MKNIIKDKYYIDFYGRIKSIQEQMKKNGLDVYLGSRLRTISWTVDAFCPWRTYIVIPKSGLPTVFTFVLDAARVADDSWLEADNVLGYIGMGGQDQISAITDFIKEELKCGTGKIGYESGISNYLPEGNLSLYEYEQFRKALPEAQFINSHDIIDRLSLIKDEGTINRFREASRLTDIGHQAVYDAIKDGDYEGMTETEIAGLAAYAMRKAGSVLEWSFTGGNEIAVGYRTGFGAGACTPATTKKLEKGMPFMVDLHAMFKLGLGDHTVNYFLRKPTPRQRWHADNFLSIVDLTLKSYRAGISPNSLAVEMLDFADSKGFADYMVPGFEHGIGMFGDEWRIGMNDGEIPYWTNPEHIYQPNEMVICAMQYACPDEEIGFRYEAPIVIRQNDCELLPTFPLEVKEV